MIPGTANVTGIAFTAILGVISFIIILASSNSHYWGHIQPSGSAIRSKIHFGSGRVFECIHQTVCLNYKVVCKHGGRAYYYYLFNIDDIHLCRKDRSGAGWGVSPVSLAFTIFIYFIEVLVAFLQVFYFHHVNCGFHRFRHLKENTIAKEGAAAHH